jgi:hypothetical protein
MPADPSTQSRVRISIRMWALRLSDKPAEFLARLFARMLALKAQSLLISSSKKAARPEVLMLLKESTLTCSKRVSLTPLRL